MKKIFIFVFLLLFSINANAGKKAKKGHKKPSTSTSSHHGAGAPATKEHEREDDHSGEMPFCDFLFIQEKIIEPILIRNFFHGKTIEELSDFEANKEDYFRALNEIERHIISSYKGDISFKRNILSALRAAHEECMYFKYLEIYKDSPKNSILVTIELTKILDSIRENAVQSEMHHLGRKVWNRAGFYETEESPQLGYSLIEYMTERLFPEDGEDEESPPRLQDLFEDKYSPFALVFPTSRAKDGFFGAAKAKIEEAAFLSDFVLEYKDIVSPDARAMVFDPLLYILDGKNSLRILLVDELFPDFVPEVLGIENYNGRHFKVGDYILFPANKKRRTGEIAFASYEAAGPIARIYLYEHTQGYIKLTEEDFEDFSYIDSMSPVQKNEKLWHTAVKKLTGKSNPFVERALLRKTKKTTSLSPFSRKRGLRALPLKSAERKAYGGAGIGIELPSEDEEDEEVFVPTAPANAARLPSPVEDEEAVVTTAPANAARLPSPVEDEEVFVPTAPANAARLPSPVENEEAVVTTAAAVDVRLPSPIVAEEVVVTTAVADDVRLASTVEDEEGVVTTAVAVPVALPPDDTRRSAPLAQGLAAVPAFVPRHSPLPRPYPIEQAATPSYRAPYMHGGVRAPFMPNQFGHLYPRGFHPAMRPPMVPYTQVMVPTAFTTDGFGRLYPTGFQAIMTPVVPSAFPF